MANAAKPKAGESLTRGFTLQRESVDVENRRVTMAISSEAPYRRWFGMEILGHNADEVDLGRLKDGTHPLLWNHDTNTVIGVVERARLDADKIIRVTARFAKNAEAEEKWQDVQDGILSLASVRYEVDEWKITKDKTGNEEWRAVKWTPLEASLVSIPADPSVGIGRKKDSMPKEKQDDHSDEDGNQQEQEQESFSAKRAKELESKEREKNQRRDDAPNIETARKSATDLERKRVQNILKLGEQFKCQERAAKAAADGDEYEEFRESLFGDVMSGKLSPNGQPQALGKPSDATNRRESIGEMFVRMADFAGKPHLKGKKLSRFVSIDNRDRFVGQRTTLNSETGTDLVAITDYPGLIVPDRRVLRIADILPTGSITGNSFRYLQETSFTNAATAVAEGAAKPEATLVLNQTTNNVEKIAVWTKVTEEMFMDFPIVRGYVDNALTYMVQAEEERQLLSGSGAANELTGLLNVSNIQTQSCAGLALPHDGFHKAITKIRDVGNVEPNWVVVNPYDWERLKLTKDSNGQYLGGGPFIQQYGTGPYSNVGLIWGVPAVITSAITAGTALVLNSMVAAMILRRTGLMLASTNTDQDDFIKNLVTIRAEQYQLLATWKPRAICTVTDIPQ